jgi:hypothetical protein
MNDDIHTLEELEMRSCTCGELWDPAIAAASDSPPPPDDSDEFPD